MLDFKRLELKDIELVRPFFQYATNRLCDFSIGGSVLWRNTFNIRYAIYDNTLIMKQSYLNDVIYFVPPVGEHPDEGFRQIRRWCAGNGTQLRLCVLAEKDLDRLPYRDKWEIEKSENWGDYVYPAEQLMTLQGRRLAGQRNHINYFTKTWPDWKVERITSENLPGVRALLEEYSKKISKDSHLFYEEVAADEEVLNHFDEYGFLSLCLKAGGKVVAYAAGETIGDTLFVHIEKADRTCRGAYQMIVREFARAYAADGIKYINREDDSGDEGLRQAKLAYHPSEILEKYTAVYMGEL